MGKLLPRPRRPGEGAGAPKHRHARTSSPRRSLSPEGLYLFPGFSVTLCSTQALHSLIYLWEIRRASLWLLIGGTSS